jgi:hypothetical protein
MTTKATRNAQDTTSEGTLFVSNSRSTIKPSNHGDLPVAFS